MNQLTEAKELNRQAAEKIKEYELLEEARRRGFVEGVKFISIKYGGTKVLENGVFIYKDDDGTHLIDKEPGNGNFIYEAKKGWAEIIPEEEKKEIETCPTCSFMKSGSVICPDPSHGRESEKSLHDQIREGGWEKVFELAGFNIKSTCTEIVPIHPINENETHPLKKVNNYIRLLALSKVLNEGKERDDKIYTVSCRDGKLERVDFKYISQPIEFYCKQDRDFALDFAEKEWKIFYNAKS